MMDYFIALVTAPDLETAQNLARKALLGKCCACVNIISRVQSMYIWEGQFMEQLEEQLIFKTTGPCIKALEELVLQEHPYDVPEFIVLPISHIEDRYRAWLEDSTRQVQI